MADNQRRVRDVSAEDNYSEVEDAIDFSEAVICESDETTWVLVGNTWVDSSRIITVGPMANAFDPDNPPLDELGVSKYPEGGVAVQIDSPHADSQFVFNSTDTVEEIMSRILEATSETE